MKWPWGTTMTEIQAKELAGYFLAISQATLIGSAGYIFISEADFIKKTLTLILGTFAAIMLLFIGMRLLRELKN